MHRIGIVGKHTNNNVPQLHGNYVVNWSRILSASGCLNDCLAQCGSMRRAHMMVAYWGDKGGGRGCARQMVKIKLTDYCHELV